MNQPLSKFIKRFLGHYLPVQKGLSINTIMAYRDAVKLLLRHVSDTLKKPVDALSVGDMTEKAILRFLDDIQDARCCDPKTRNARLAAIHSLFAFIAREEPILLPQCQRIRAIPLKRTEHKTACYLEEKEMQAILDAVDVNTRPGVRDRSLLLLLYNTGARVSEIINLKVSDLRLQRVGQVHLVGKGDKHRSCPLWPETVTALRLYLKQRAPKSGIEELFLNSNNQPLSRFGARHVIGKYVSVALNRCPSLKGKSISPHTIRHTTAMHLLRAGNDINMVSYWLGHADINTTHIYVEIDMEMKRRMLEKTKAPTIAAKTQWHEPDILTWLNNLAKDSQLCEVKL